MSAHTAGNWFVTHDANYGAELAIDTIVEGNTVHIALVHGVGTDEETSANAALIANAPELAEVLRLTLAALDGKPYRQLAIDHARAVLAKVEGKYMFMKQPSLAVTTAQRLARFVRAEFDPKSDASWVTVDKLWRAALLSRDAERSAPAQIVNFVSTQTGEVCAVCEFCNRRSPPVRADRDGGPCMWSLPTGWSCAPYPRDFVHEDGSVGDLWTCPACDKRLDKGESLFPHESRRAARQGRQS